MGGSREKSAQAAGAGEKRGVKEDKRGGRLKPKKGSGTIQE